MPKTFKVWIEVEEYDEETGEGTSIDLSFAATAEFATLEEATAYAADLHATAGGEFGEQLA